MIRRREFIVGLASATAWPAVVRAQQQLGRMRRVGVFSNLIEDDPEAQARHAAFLQGLKELGWTVGVNVQIEYRWGAVGNADQIRKYATELISLTPDVIVAIGGSTVGPLQRATRAVPIVFANVADPVGAGFVESLARPGGNTTGFASREYGFSAKWLELLKQIAPDVRRVAVIRDAAITAGIGQFGAVQAMALSLGLDVSPVNVLDAREIEQAIGRFAGSRNGGLIVTGSALVAVHRDLIVALAARYKLPAVYYQSAFVAAGGLISYGSNVVDQCKRAASYVDRILRGEKPADLPVQTPIKYETVVNLKTAKALGLTIPETLLATADEVIQ
jgi:putative ABC transport system substrate-binding protein